MLIALIAAAAEVVVNILLYFPWDIVFLLFERRRPKPGERFEHPVIAIALVGMLIGGAMGGVSLQVVRQTMLPYAALRIGNIVVSPMASGLLARAAARRRSARGEVSSPRHHFVFAYALTLGLVLVRFVHAIRPK